MVNDGMPPKELVLGFYAIIIIISVYCVIRSLLSGVKK